jgi:hypothetical protein
MALSVYDLGDGTVALECPTIFASCKLPFAAIGTNWSHLDLTSATILNLPTDLTGLVAVGVRLSPEFRPRSSPEPHSPGWISVALRSPAPTSRVRT